MDYYELRKAVARIVPRQTRLHYGTGRRFREKGRKSNYHQYDLVKGGWKPLSRLLREDEIDSFLEVSLRASACPLPFNLDVWDGLVCPFGCKYCFANAFRVSLYTAFFDNSKTIGLRHCNPEYYKRQLDKMLKLRGGPLDGLSGTRKAFAMGIPIRMGIRFEDFLYKEKKAGVSLEMLRYLADIEYPVMINTKSDVVGMDEYVDALSRNKGGSAVHVTVISSNDRILKRLEPGAPSFARRLWAIKNLVSAGVRVVARIEPYIFLLNDDREDVNHYIEVMWEAGVRNITFDTYSYTAVNPNIRQAILEAGLDFDRLYLAGCDSQPFGSLLLGRFMELFRERGFSCSTFDMGNVPDNSQSVCCEVEDWFKGRFNYGSTVMAARFIKDRPSQGVRWKEYEEWVNLNGGFLSEQLREEVKRLWNVGGNDAYSHCWARGMVPVGKDEDGIIWRYEPERADYREELLRGLLD